MQPPVSNAGKTPRRRSAPMQTAPDRVMQAAKAMRQPAGQGWTQQTAAAQMQRQQTGRTGAPLNQLSGQQRMIRNTYTGSNGYIPPDNVRYQLAGSREQPKKPKKTKGKILKRVMAVLGVMVLLAGAAVFGRIWYQRRQMEAEAASYDNVYVDGVWVDGINLSGMSAQEGYDAVIAQAQARNDAWYVNLTFNGQTLTTLTASQLGMKADAAEVLKEAWQLGHTGDAAARLAEIAKLRESPWQGYTATPGGDTSYLDQVLAQVKAAIERNPSDAYMTAFVPENAYPFEFSEEIVGYRLDTAPLKDQIYHLVSTMSSGNVEIQPEVLQPRVTVADLKEKLSIRASVYTPVSKDSTENRTNNIRRCFEIINGYILQPGKKFSFNTVVGQRTLKNGFYEAIEYAYGEHVMGVGGGTCQASTTVYQAAVTAGLNIVDRSPHSDSVSYASYGEDATVYWEGKRKIDLVFTNSTDSPIYIVAKVENDPSNNKRLIARCTMYGMSLGNTRYELQSEEIEEIPIPEEPKYRKDQNHTYVTYVDEEKKTSDGKTGHVVVSYRVTYENDEEVSRKQLYKDTYKAQPVVYYVGTEKRDN